jgi:predicted RNase H-like nuclease
MEIALVFLVGRQDLRARVYSGHPSLSHMLLQMDQAMAG